MVEFNIQARRSGKTTELMRRFLENYSNSMFISVYGSRNKGCLDAKIKARMLSLCEFLGQYSDFSYNTIFIDDYLLLSDGLKQDSYELLNRLGQSLDIIIYTTSNKIYNQEYLELARLTKESNNSKLLRKHLAIPSDYYYNLLTEPKVIINNIIKISSAGLNAAQIRADICGEY